MKRDTNLAKKRERIEEKNEEKNEERMNDKQSQESSELSSGNSDVEDLFRDEDEMPSSKNFFLLFFYSFSLKKTNFFLKIKKKFKK